MSGRRKYDDDDGRVIADMSGLESQPRFLPGTGGREKASRQTVNNDRPWESSMTPEERRWTILAALKASMLIALAFILGLGAVILLMVLIW